MKKEGILVIALSGKAQSGKSTAKGIICEKLKQMYGSRCRVIDIPFAKKLKEICADLFDWDGSKEIFYNEKQVFSAEGSYVDKEVISDLGRPLLINVGNKMREIRPTIWCNYAIKQIKNDISVKKGDLFVYIIDDLRYKNEAMTLLSNFKREDLKLIRIDRKDSLHLDHISETDLDIWSEWDKKIINNGSLEELRESLSSILE